MYPFKDLIRKSFTAVVLLLGPVIAIADSVLANNLQPLPPDGTGIVTTISDYSFPFQVADEFMVSGTGNYDVSTVTWVGTPSAELISQGGSAPESFDLLFYGVGSDGSPNSLPFASVLLTSGVNELATTTTGLSTYSASISTPIALSGGASYFFSVVANTPDNASNDHWGWFFLNQPSDSYSRSGDSSSWVVRDLHDYSFEIAGTPVPLPASAWLMLTALGGLGFTARRRN